MQYEESFGSVVIKTWVNRTGRTLFPRFPGWKVHDGCELQPGLTDGFGKGKRIMAEVVDTLGYGF
jgi:hypothetical protein